MKKAQGFFLIFLFVACGVLGILVANQVMNGREKATPTPVLLPTRTAGAPGTGQTNLVLLRVDDLSSPTPRLISIWIAFLGPADYPGLTVMALYPNLENPAQIQPLADSFALGSDNLPVPEFWQQLAAFNFTWDGYLLADTQAISPILGWINNTQTALTAQPATDGEGYRVILEEETSVFKEICVTLSDTAEVSGQAPDWGSIIPLHMRTDMTFEAMMYSWGKLNTPGAVTPCYILGNP
ncbi:MAG: hypothetical protein ABFD58_02770 [Anaerolineaceae bacterium]